MTPITVVIVEDHTLVREGTRELLEQAGDVRVIGEAATGDAAVAVIARLRPHVALLDLRLPDHNGIEVAARVAASAPTVRILILSAYDDADYVAAALDAGAAGYVLKTVGGGELVEAVRAVARGQTVLQDAAARELTQHLRPPHLDAGDGASRLSPRELEVLRLLAQGQANKEIAQTLGLSVRTVEGHFGSIFAKLGVASRTDAVLCAIHRRLLATEGIWDAEASRR